MKKFTNWFKSLLDFNKDGSVNKADSTTIKLDLEDKTDTYVEKKMQKDSILPTLLVFSLLSLAIGFGLGRLSL